MGSGLCIVSPRCSSTENAGRTMTVLWNALCGDDFNQTPVSKIFSEKIQFFFCFGGRCITGESDLVPYGPRGGRVARREKRELERPRIVQNLGQGYPILRRTRTDFVQATTSHCRPCIKSGLPWGAPCRCSSGATPRVGLKRSPVPKNASVVPGELTLRRTNPHPAVKAVG